MGADWRNTEDELQRAPESVKLLIIVHCHDAIRGGLPVPEVIRQAGLDAVENHLEHGKTRTQLLPRE